MQEEEASILQHCARRELYSHTVFLTHPSSCRVELPMAILSLCLWLGFLSLSSSLSPTLSYGPSIQIHLAKKAASLAIAEATANNWAMSVAVCDGGGDLMYFEKMDETQLGSVQVAQNKARSAARFKRPTLEFQDALTAPDGLRVLSIEGAVPVEGGIPLVVEGRVVGAIGVSGGTSAQDGQCARCALDLI
ncbi:hypothetical protein B484DRAFT_484651 [Ochromonadaceae sp. CCMP2298]|nr:hypothetical protein B484DRAFT_484651 [Ochromonadaceae sp. CCMP2298]